MNRGFLCGVVLVVVSVTTRSQGERIALLVTPTTIYPGLTPNLTIRCVLEDDGEIRFYRASIMTIRKAAATIDEEEVAIIQSGKAATGEFLPEGATVTGELSNKVRYLQVTLPSSRGDEAGQYSCDVWGVSSDGSIIGIVSTIQNVSTGKNVDSSDSKHCPCTTDIEALKKAVGDRRREFDFLKKTVDDLKTNNGGLSSVHNEEGIVSCMNSDSWGARLTERETVVEVRFSNPYARNPQVVVSPVVLDVEKLMNLRYRIEIRDLTAIGFKVVCGTWWDTLLHRIDVRWTSSVA